MTQTKRVKRIIKSIDALRQWIQDGFLIKIFKNAGILLFGNIGASLLGLVSLALTARKLGPEYFGILVLISTYVSVVDRLVNFQSWQALIKYGAGVLEQGRTEDFKALLLFGFLLDVGTAIVGTIIAASVASFVGEWQGWNPDAVLMATFFSLTILFHISGTPTAILRLFDRYKLFSFIAVTASGVKLFGVCIAFATDAGLWAFIFVWAVTDIFGKILLITLSLRELARQQYHLLYLRSTQLHGINTLFPGIWRFVLTTNIQTSIKGVLRDFDIFIGAYFVGPSLVGSLKIIKQFSGILGQVTDPLFQVMLPSFSILSAKHLYIELSEKVVKIGLISALVSIPAWFLIFIFGEEMLLILLGDSFKQYAHIWSIYFIAVVILTITNPVNPALLSIGSTDKYLISTVIASIVYVPSSMVLTIYFKEIGLVLGWVLYATVWAVMSVTMLLNDLNDKVNNVHI